MAISGSSFYFLGKFGHANPDVLVAITLGHVPERSYQVNAHGDVHWDALCISVGNVGSCKHYKRPLLGKWIHWCIYRMV